MIENITLGNFKSRHLSIPSSKTPLVFIPGNLQEIESLKEFNKQLSKNSDYHILELPGTGLTEPLEPTYPITFLSDCLSEFHRKYIRKPFNLVTCSYATAIGIEFAKDHPDKLKKLVLAGSMERIPKENWPSLINLMSECMNDKERFARNFINSLTADEKKIPRLETIKKAAIRKAKQYEANQVWSFIYNSIRLMSYDANNFCKIKTPSLCFTGQFDPFVKPEYCKNLAQAIPNAEFTLIKEADHLFHIEKPDETIKLISTYLLDEYSLVA